MEKQNPLLPFAYSSLSYNDHLPLNTSPRDRTTIDENASSQYHTRTPQSRRPVLKFMPTLKRKMGESFNENDDIKRRDMVFGSDPLDSDPTMIDDDEAHDENEIPRGPVKYPTKQLERSETPKPSKYPSLPPSSPVIEPHIMSEFDFTTDTTHTFTVPESPKRRYDNPKHENDVEVQDLSSEVDYIKPEGPITYSQAYSQTYSQTYSPQKNQHVSSDADFGIDHFNRYKNPSVSECPSSSVDREYEDLKILSYNKARDYIIEAFEEIRTTINLENMNLHDIPDEIKDLNNLVIFGNELDPISYQLYLTSNKLRELPPSLFKFTKLNVLGLRQNKLTKIPPIVSQLVNLTDLSLGSNRLNYFPYQVLDLPKLQTFRAGPNPFIPIPEDAIYPESDHDPIRKRVCVSKIKYLVADSRRSTVVPSLKCLCLNQIAGYDVSYQETKNWKKHTPKIYHSLIIKAIMAGKYKDTCSECTNFVVEPFAEVIEWWDILKNKNVPFKRQFCSGGCVRKYLNHPDNQALTNQLVVDQY